MLRDLDVLVIDLQDVGVRIYTYIYTMANCLKAARRHGLKVIVCDRPNPIGGAAGRRADARAAASSRSSGMYPIPMRHGMTIGELARLFNEQFGIGADLEVIAMEGWRREMYCDDTGLTVDHLVAEHPDVRHDDGVSRRRAVRRHERVGRPRHDPAVRAARRAVGGRRAIRRRDEPARSARRLLPPGGLRADVPQARRQGAAPACQIHVAAIGATFRPVEAGVALIEAFRASDPDRFRWKDPPYEYEYEKMPIDCLAGSSTLREQIDAGVPAHEIAASWTEPVDAFLKIRERVLFLARTSPVRGVRLQADRQRQLRLRCADVGPANAFAKASALKKPDPTTDRHTSRQRRRAYNRHPRIAGGRAWSSAKLPSLSYWRSVSLSPRIRRRPSTSLRAGPHAPSRRLRRPSPSTPTTSAAS